MKQRNLLSIDLFKSLALLFSLTLISFACNQQTETSSSKEMEFADPLEGVWELTNHYWVTEWDTFYDDNVGVQHKIYLDGYVMWTADPSPDSSEWHGYGTYQFKNDTLIETLLSMSLPMKEAMGSDEEVILTVKYDDNSFKQANQGVYNDTVFYNTEEWKRIK